MANPKILKNFHLYLNGGSYAGIADEVTLPTLSLTTEDHRAGGMDAPVKIDVGMEAMELGCKLSEHSAAVYSQFGLADQNGVQAQFRGAMVDGNNAEPYVVTCRGMVTEVTSGTVVTGQKNGLEVTIALRYYKLEINGVTVIEIDVDNMERTIGGVDQLAQQRAILNG